MTVKSRQRAGVEHDETSFHGYTDRKAYDEQNSGPAGMESNYAADAQLGQPQDGPDFTLDQADKSRAATQGISWPDPHGGRASFYEAEFDTRAISQAAERGAILGTRRLDKVRAEWRDFARRFESTALTAAELRRLRMDLRRREMLLFLLGGFVLVMGTLYGALLFSSPQLLGNPRSEFGCTMFGGSWSETSSNKQYCIFWAN